MDFHNIKNVSKRNLYINKRKIKVIETFELFDLCKVIYEDTQEEAVIDKLGISDEKINSEFIAINY